MIPATGSLDASFKFPYLFGGTGNTKEFADIFTIFNTKPERPDGCTFVCNLEDSLNSGSLSYPEITMIYDALQSEVS